MIKYCFEDDPVNLMKKHLPMLESHREEVSRFGDDIPLDPDWDRYYQLFESDSLCMIGMHQGDKLIGYTVNLMFRHLHYNFKMGYTDLIYIKPGYRGHALRLIKNTERLLKTLGVDIYNITVKPHVDFRKVLEKLGYTFLEYNYIRRL